MPQIQVFGLSLALKYYSYNDVQSFDSTKRPRQMKQKTIKVVSYPKANKRKQKKNPSGNTSSGHNNKNITIMSKKGNKQISFVRSENEPLVVSRSIKMSSPKYEYGGKGSVILKHTELLATVTSNNKGENVNGFNIIGIHVNAGLNKSFPFLSSLAYNYKSFEFNKLQYCFVSRCPTITTGAVMMYAEYDPSVSPPENRIEFMNRSNAEEVQVFKNLNYPLNKKDMKKEMSHYIRLGTLAKDQDIKLYDVATFWFGYEGTPKQTLLGDIFVQYEAVLQTPTLRLAEKQIKGIETCKGLCPVTDSATEKAPFGPLLAAGSFVGDFVGSLLNTAFNTATGGFAGQIFSTGKTIFKLISAFLPKKVNDTPDTLDLQVSVAHYNYDGFNIKGEDFLILDEDSGDFLYELNNALDQDAIDKIAIDITATNSIKSLDAVDVYGARFVQWMVAVPQGGVFRIQHPSGSTKFAGGKPTVDISDLDARKINLLSNNTLFGINDL